MRVEWAIVEDGEIVTRGRDQIDLALKRVRRVHAKGLKIYVDHPYTGEADGWLPELRDTPRRADEPMDEPEFVRETVTMTELRERVEALEAKDAEPTR